MAYNSNNKTEKTLVDIPKNKSGELVRVSRIESNGLVAFDIRNMYTNDAGEICFTSKGVRFREDMMDQIIVSLLNSIDADHYNVIIDQLDHSNKLL